VAGRRQRPPRRSSPPAETITHHHAVGRDHAADLEAEIGETGVAALRAVKRELDPAGVMTPGKLLPPISHVM
jgi:alkyldihydroxyacetonephosphate synthase